MVTLREGILSAGRVVDLRSVSGAAGFRWEVDGSLRIGASETLASISANAEVAQAFPALAMACDAVGSPALCHMGTLGGNLCQRPRCWYFRSGVSCFKSGGDGCPAVAGENQHLAIMDGGPCHAVHPSDPAVALVALDASVVIASSGGERIVPADGFFTGPRLDPTRETVLEPGEVVMAVSVPAASRGTFQWFRKELQRGAWDFALASVAVVRQMDGAVRIVLGGVAPTPYRVNPSIEEDVAAGPLAADDLDALAERALYDARPLSGNGYKVDLAAALLREAMSRASGATT